MTPIGRWREACQINYQQPWHSMDSTGLVLDATGVVKKQSIVQTWHTITIIVDLGEGTLLLASNSRATNAYG